MKKYIVLLSLICVLTSAKAQVVGLEVGDIAPEIDLPDTTGNTIALSSLRGDVVLIDFWASWCLPCINEQGELLKLYNLYPDKFQIYGVSLDSKKATWTGLVSKIKQPWSQVSDLKYWNSEAAKEYRVQALPFNILIDKNGIILAKNIHGNKLNDFVKGLMTK